MFRLEISPAFRASGFYLTFFFTLAVYLPFLNIYFRTLGMSGWQIGILAALMPTGSFLAVPLITMLADRLGWRIRLLTASVCGTAAALLLFLVPTKFLSLVLVMAFFSVTYSAVVPLADTSIVRMSVRHDLNYGGLRLWGSLGYAISATASGVLWQHTGYRPMFVVAALFSLAVALSAHSLENVPGQERREPAPLGSILNDRLLMGVLISTLLAASAIGMEFTFVGIYMSNLGGSGLLLGMLFGVSALCELPGMRYSSRIGSRIGPGFALVLAYGFLTLAYVGYAASPNPYVLLAFSLLRGLGYGLFYVGTVHFLNARAPHGWAATVQGIMNATAYGLGQLISRPLAGRIFDVYGPRVLYVVCASLSVLAALVMTVMVGAHDVPANESAGL
jgi:PPP family 3-phenylpropionic acid transporter